MKTYTQTELAEVLRLHTLWRQGMAEGVRANLSGANLSRADLSGANLSRANLSRADLSGANLYCATPVMTGHQIATFRIVPEVGGFYGFKKVSNQAVLKIFIPEDAKRLNSFGSRKCRASKIKVMEIAIEGDTPGQTIFKSSTHDTKLEYSVGQEVSVSDFCDDLKQECAAGIHFFLTLEEAKAW